jgi:hypothetical protein
MTTLGLASGAAITQSMGPKPAAQTIPQP